MDLRKINNILGLFLDLSAKEQQTLLNLLVENTPKPKDISPPKVEEILEEIRKASSKVNNQVPRDYSPFVKKGDPHFPTIIY